MSMMMPPDPSVGLGGPPGMPPDGGGGPPGMPLPPGGGGAAPGIAPPMDALSSSPLPGDQGIEGLIAALQGGGGGGPGEEVGPGEPGGPGEEQGEPGALGQALGAEPGSPDMRDMTPVEHIQHAMKHLMMAMAGSQDQEQGHGIVKGMGALQALLGGEQKKQKLLANAGG